MAKKKRNRKRRPAQRRPGQVSAAVSTAQRTNEVTHPSRRAERKEEARRERERRIKQARRRQRTRRMVRWGIVAAALAVVAGLIWVGVRRGAEQEARLNTVLAAAGCGEVEEPTDEGAEHLQAGDPEPTYGTTPAASGPHDPTPLPSDPAVYSQPIPERTAVHNLEHGYVLLWYRADGPGALGGNEISALEDVAEDEAEVIMAPYENLSEGTNLAMVAWTRLVECDTSTGDPQELGDAARAFIDEFRNATAPEAEVP